MLAIELQVARFVSDLESEKDTRARVNSDINAKLDKISDNQERSDRVFSEKQEKTNRIVYMMLGGLTVLQIVLQFAKP